MDNPKRLRISTFVDIDAKRQRKLIIEDSSDDDFDGEDLDSNEERSEEDEDLDTEDIDFIVDDFEEEEEEPFQLNPADADPSFSNMVFHLYASSLYDVMGCQLEGSSTMKAEDALNRARKELNGTWSGKDSTNSSVISFKRFLSLRQSIGLKLQQEELVCIDQNGKINFLPGIDPSWVKSYQLNNSLKSMIENDIQANWGLDPEADPQERIDHYQSKFENQMIESLKDFIKSVYIFLNNEQILQSQDLSF